MQHNGFVLLLASLVVTAAQAEAPKSTQPATDFGTLKKEYDEAEVAYRDVVAKKFAEAKAAGKRLYIPFDETPPARFASRFVAFAEQNPGDPSAFDAIGLAVYGSHTDRETRDRTLRLLRATYLTDPKIKRFVQLLVISHDDESDKLIYEIIARNPDRDVRILAYKALINRAEQAIQLAERIEADKALRNDMETTEGEDYVAKALARAERARAELESLRTVSHDLYGERVPDLSIGKPAPELVGLTLDGKSVKLSDYRGKVVVLDVWATWCAPCREMIPHERAMVARLKDKPFVLVSISVDEEKETLTKFLAAEEMPWTHWWNGAEGKIIETLDIQHYPTIFVLDAKGVIRAKEVRGEPLEETVNKLLEEIEAKAAE